MFILTVIGWLKPLKILTTEAGNIRNVFFMTNARFVGSSVNLFKNNLAAFKMLKTHLRILSKTP